MYVAVKQSEFAAFSVQDALEAPMAAPAPRELPREFPESLRKPPRCFREQKKTMFGFSRYGYHFASCFAQLQLFWALALVLSLAM